MDEKVTRTLNAVLRADPEAAVLAQVAGALVNLHSEQRGRFGRIFGNPGKPHFAARTQMLDMVDSSTAPDLTKKIEAEFKRRWEGPATLSAYEDKEQNYYSIGVQTSSGQDVSDSWEERMRNHSAT